MAIKSILSQPLAHTVKLTTQFATVVLCGSLLLGCQTLRREESRSGQPTGAAPQSTHSPGVPTSQVPSIPEPPPSRTETKKVAVILGPGGAKAFAHVGVLKAFQQQRIPIDKIVGLEWGALVAGLYSSKGQVNDLEWKLYKMEQRQLPRTKSFFKRSIGDESIQVMESYFGEVFGRELVGGGRVPFACPSRSVWSGVVTWQTKGAMAASMKRCLPFPPIFKPQGTFIAGASQVTEAIDWLRRDGYNVIVVVNVLGSAMPANQDSLLERLESVILWQEVKRALAESARYHIDYVNVDTSTFPMVQFESKKDLVSLGEAAGQKAARELISKYGF